MRQRSSMTFGENFQDRFTTLIKLRGEYVTVTRSPTTQGGSTTSQRLLCSPQPVAWTNAEMLNREGNDNLAESMQVNFIFLSNANVKPTVDSVVWNGWNHRILTVKPPRLSGTTIVKEALGIRTSPNPS